MPHLGYSRTVFSGHLPGGEIFGWSLWCSESPTTQGGAQSQANMIAAAFTSNSADAAQFHPHQLLSADAGYDQVTVYSYVTGGNAADFTAIAGLALPGTSAYAHLPNQCAVTVSLHTEAAGRSARGRVYLPINSYGLGPGGQLPSDVLLKLATSMSNLIHLINGDVTPAKAVVYSQKHGTSHPITAVKIDSKVDIQRRRANRQAATGQAVVVVA